MPLDLRPSLLVSSLSLSLALTAGCGGSDAGGSSTPCDTTELQLACQTECSSDADCLGGTYCDGGSCTADCVFGSSEYACAGGGLCALNGRCAGGAGDAGEGGGGDGGPGADSGSGEGGSVGCGEVQLSGDPNTPNVIFVIDQSASMDQGFGNDGQNRWTALKSVLIDDGGLIPELQDVVRFGVALYSGREGAAECPMLTNVEFAIDNLDAIRATYGPAETIADTPTGDAIDAVLDGLLANGSIGDSLLESTGEPVIFVLATDGEPDRCEQLNPQNGQEEAVTAVERAYMLGVRTFVIAVAEENEISQGHLTDMANAGQGVGTGQADAESYRVSEPGALRDTLLNIVGGEISCVVPFTAGRVTAADPCVGSVTLNGTPLECNGPDGWRLVDPETVEVLGSACAELKQGAELNAVFDCDSASLI